MIGRIVCWSPCTHFDRIISDDSMHLIFCLYLSLFLSFGILWIVSNITRQCMDKCFFFRCDLINHFIWVVNKCFVCSGKNIEAIKLTHQVIYWLDYSFRKTMACEWIPYSWLNDFIFIDTVYFFFRLWPQKRECRWPKTKKNSSENLSFRFYREKNDATGFVSLLVWTHPSNDLHWIALPHFVITAVAVKFERDDGIRSIHVKTGLKHFGNLVALLVVLLNLAFENS